MSCNTIDWSLLVIINVAAETNYKEDKSQVYYF